MISGRKSAWQVCIILLVLCATMSLQGASLTTHNHSQASDHCCGVCHAGHLVMLATVAIVPSGAPTNAEWFTPASSSAETLEPLIAAGLSRAPPA